MNEAEREIAEKLAECWELYNALPEEHSMEKREFCEKIHDLQNQVAARSVWREERHRTANAAC